LTACLLVVACLVGCEAGSATVEPSDAVAGEFGTWTVTWTAPWGGLASGASLHVELPDSWNYGERNSLKVLQTTDPAADNYVSATSSASDVRLSTAVSEDYDEEFVKTTRLSLDGRLERYVLVVRVDVQRGRLGEGDTIDVVFGDTAGGSRGLSAATVTTGPAEILVAVDRNGPGGPRLVDDRPLVRVRPGDPVELLLSGPSTLVVDVPAELRLALVDEHANLVELSSPGEISLAVAAGDADLAATVAIEPGGGWATASFVPRGVGIVRVEATFSEADLEARSNPMRALEEEPDRRLYWGDLHSHTHFSHDGVGGASFDYARNASGLDFYAMTDHSLAAIDGAPRGLSEHLWDEYTTLTEAHHDPGSFVTIHGYELSFGSPWGHHNVYFRGQPGALIVGTARSLPEVWDLLRAGEALTIPHHTGKFPDIDWTVDEPELRRNIEIYSAHGLSEVDDPSHPLAFNNTGFSAPRPPGDFPLFVQDAWRQGFELSTIASSDDHVSQPGKPHFGLAAVWAGALERGDVFDGLYERRTYGTTGERILLDFTVEGVAMGGRVTATGELGVRVEAHGTDRIEMIELLRATASSDSFEVLARIEPDSADVDWDQQVVAPGEDSIYYVRLRQASEVRGRISMAWSSPIWVDLP